jgi:excisionase family DNA binding protein
VYNSFGDEIMTNNDDWLTVNEAAELVDYHEETIRELARNGKITARKISIVWQVSRKSLLKYVKKVEELGGKRGPKPEEQ